MKRTREENLEEKVMNFVNNFTYDAEAASKHKKQKLESLLDLNEDLFQLQSPTENEFFILEEPTEQDFHKSPRRKSSKEEERKNSKELKKNKKSFKINSLYF
jgi:hypothetical protein